MDATYPVHPSRDELLLYALGKIEDGRAEAVRGHLEHCEECREEVAGATADSFVMGIQNAMGNPADAEVSASSRTLPPGLSEHPDFEIKSELGRGGMGVVYLVHNKLMGRDEVIKVM